jgi:hypothetical protein
LPGRPNGVQSNQTPPYWGSLKNGSAMGVAMYPGAMALIRMPYSAHSAASDLVRWTTAALDVL